MRKMTLRLDDDMHRVLAEQARAEHRSLHSLFIHALAEYLHRIATPADSKD